MDNNNNNERKPQSYRDDYNTIRFTWEDATEADLHAIRDMMYNQARKFDETMDGKAWSKLFVGNGAFKMSKPTMTLFQDKYNVSYSYSAMRNFLKSEFGIDTPLPRHEKVDLPYEDHPDNVMAEIQTRVSKEALDPNTLGNEYDINDPKNADDVQRAIEEAQRDLETLDFEELAAEQLAENSAADIATMKDLIDKDIVFEKRCQELNIDPVQYAKMHFELRGNGPAISFEEALDQLSSFDISILERYIDRKNNEAKGIYSDEPLSSILSGPSTPSASTEEPSKKVENGVGGPTASSNFDSLLDDQHSGSNGRDSAEKMNMGDHIRKTSEQAAEKPEASPINQYMKQIQQQEAGKSGAKPSYDPKSDQDKKQPNRPMMQPAMGLSLRLPFEEKISAMFSGAISYPGSKYRNYRDAVHSKKRVVESRNSLLRDLSHVGANFADMTPEQKLNAVKRITETVNDYLGDIKDAGEVAIQTKDASLRKFLKDEHDGPCDLIKKAASACADKHQELDDLKKHIEKSVESIKKIIRALISAIFGRKGPGPESPSP